MLKLNSILIRFVIPKYNYSTYSVNLTTRRRLEALRAMALPLSRPTPIIMKLQSPEFKAIFTPEVETLSTTFRNYGYEIRIAGGAVRDLLLEKQPQDLDFATTATPIEMKSMFEKEGIRMVNNNGERHGTITPRINDKVNFEVTTLRIDVETDGRHAQVQFTKDWLLDAMRRDLTINSMFLGLDGSVYDYFYGYEDLKNERIRFVGAAEKRIQEDYLRILRYFRFYGKLCKNPDNHDPATIEVIIRNRDGLEEISKERIWTELKKILEGPLVFHLLKKMIECGLGPYMGIPESYDKEKLEELSKKHKTVQYHPITILSVFLRNVDDVGRLNDQLKLSVFEREMAMFLVKNRKYVTDDPLKYYKQLLFQTKGKQSDVMKYCIELIKMENHDLLEEFMNWELPKFPINGAILKKHGVEPGKTMGMMLNELKALWIEKNFQPTADDLVRYIPNTMVKFANK